MPRFEVPEDLSALSDKELADLEAQGIAAFDDLPAADSEDLTDDDVTAMEQITNGVAAVRAEQGARVSSAEDRTSRARAAAAAVRPPEDTETETEPTPQGTPEEGDEEEDDDEQEEEQEQPKQVAAAASPRKSVVRHATRREVPTPVQETAITIVAAAEVPNVAQGAVYANTLAVTNAAIDRAKVFPKTNHIEGTYLRYGVASIQRNYMDRGRHTDHPDWRGRELDLADEVADEHNLSGGSLVAAGGWCAPSETLYDLCGGESLDGLIDLPTIGVNRGGIRFTMGPDFGDLYTNSGFCQTEAQAIAGTAKPCFEVPCTTFQEVRLDACGVCINVPILTEAGYPELVQRYVEGTMVAHEHRMSARAISTISTLIGAATAVTNDMGAAAVDVLTSLELAAEGLRYRYRLGENESLEVIAPTWLRAVIRSDLAARKNVGAENISNEQINGHFNSRGLRVQWVYNYQEDKFPGASADCVVAPPADVEVMIYRAGAFVKGTQDVISLDTVYDSVNLAKNIYTALFTEEGVLVAQRCPGACKLTIPLCISGATGGDLTGCFGAGA